MKSAYAIIFGCFILCLYACKKDSITDPGSVVGLWSIVSIASYVGVGFNNHLETYAGQRGDYYDFTSSCILYIRKGTSLDTLNYTMTTDTSITLRDPHIDGTPTPGRVTTFTANSLVIDGPYELTPAGIFGSKISLSR